MDRLYNVSSRVTGRGKMLCRNYRSYTANVLRSSLHGAQSAIRSPTAQRHKSTTAPKTPVSFAFDIDGVLLKSSKPIPGAPEALKLLKKHGIPFILLTNGGGLSEEARVSNLTRHLDTEISPKQFIQSHTPFRLHAERHGYRNVLVCGGVGETCRHVAEGYGFARVTIPFDVLARDAAIWPYHVLSPDERACAVVPTSASSSSSSSSSLVLETSGRGGTERAMEEKDAIDAIYVFHDPRDWGLDSQIILDTLLGHDYSSPPSISHPQLSPAKGQNSGEDRGRRGRRQRRQRVPIYFSNPDLLWANAFHAPRFGQGAFKILVEGLFHAVTGEELVSETIGKPSGVTYRYASRVLAEYQMAAAATTTTTGTMRKNGGGEDDTATDVGTGKDEEKEMMARGRVYMVGDNKLSDIQGANDFGWESVLVRTGVFSGTREEGCGGEVPAKYCVQDVKEAVEMVLVKEGVL